MQTVDQYRRSVSERSTCTVTRRADVAGDGHRRVNEEMTLLACENPPRCKSRRACANDKREFQGQNSSGLEPLTCTSLVHGNAGKKESAAWSRRI